MVSKRLASKALRAAVTIALTSCDMLSPSAHASVPFKAAGMKGASAQLEFYVPTTKTYFFYLNLHYLKGNREDQERVSQLLDSWARHNGQPVRLGPPIPLHLTISRMDNDRSEVVLDGQYAQHKLNGHGDDYFSDLIAFKSLHPGHYRAQIIETEDVPPLQNVPVRFDVHVPGHPT